MDTDAKLPLGARLLILTVVGIGAAGVLVRLPEVVSWQSRDIVTWLFLAAGVALAEQFPVPLRHRSETLNFSMTEAVWVGGLILARPSVLTLAVAAGLLCGQFLRRWTTYKVAFNVGQFLVALTVAQAVYRLMEPHPTLQPRAWLSAALAMGAYAVVNASLVADVTASPCNFKQPGVDTSGTQPIWTGMAQGQVDTDTTLDLWSISTDNRTANGTCASASQNNPGGEPIVETNDVNQ